MTEPAKTSAPLCPMAHPRGPQRRADGYGLCSGHIRGMHDDLAYIATRWRHLDEQHTAAAILVEVGLWEPDPLGDGWWIHNYAQRQETNNVTEAKREAQRQGAAQTNCKRYHPAGCECWKRPPLASVQ